MYLREGSWFHKFFKGIEYAFLTFALPLGIMMAAVESLYTPDHSFWFFYVVLAIDTALLHMKEHFKALKTKEIHSVRSAMPWYQAYAACMIAQFFLGVMSSHPLTTMFYYLLSLVLFSSRYLLYKRTLQKETL